MQLVQNDFSNEGDEWSSAILEIIWSESTKFLVNFCGAFCYFLIIRESSFNMTRGGEDIEGGSENF